MPKTLNLPKSDFTAPETVGLLSNLKLKDNIEKDGTFAIACTVAFSDAIFFYPTPAWYHGHIIEYIDDDILMHEYTHIAMYKLDLIKESMTFDNVFSKVNQLKTYLETGKYPEKVDKNGKKH